MKKESDSDKLNIDPADPVRRDVNIFEGYALNEIDKLEGLVREFSKKAFNVRNDFLRSCGWNISSVKTLVLDEFIDETFIYAKDGEMFMCGHDAIEYELYGE